MPSLESLAPNTNLADHAKDLQRAATEVAKDIKTEANVRLRDVTTQANARLSDAKKQAGDFYDTAHDYASENPWIAFGAGVAAGLLVAAWLRR